MIALPDISAVIRADLNPLNNAFDNARSMATRTSNAISGAFNGIGSMLSSPVVALAGMATAGLSVHAAVSKVADAFDSIDATAKSADKIGIATEAFQAMAHQADLSGVDLSTLDMGLKQMQKSLADASMGTGDAAEKFAALGLSASEMVNLSADESFGMLADSLKEISNPAERARAAMEVFGERAGPGLLNMLTAGSEGLAQAKADLEGWGVSMSRLDAGKVEVANDAISRVGRMVSGVAERIAVELSPIVQALAEYFTEAGKEGGGIGDKVAGAIGWVAMSIAKASDYLNLLSAGFYAMRGVALASILITVEGIELLGKKMVDFMNLLPGIDVQWTDTFSNIAEGLRTELADSVGKFDTAMKNFDEGTNFKKVTGALEEFKRKNEEAANSIAENAEKMRGSFEGGGSVGASVAKATDESQFFDKTDDAVSKFRESMKTPADKLDDTVMELSEWLNEGRISMEEFDKGLSKAALDAAKQMDGGEGAKEAVTPKQNQFAGLVRKGSAEALKMQFDLQQRGTNSDAVPKKHLSVAERQTALLEDIRKGLEFEIIG